MSLQFHGTNGITFNDGTILRTASQVAGAWLNVNVIGGTPQIKASYNVSSLTDNGVGDFTINFALAFVDGNYAGVFGNRDTNYMTVVRYGALVPTATAVRVGSIDASSGALVDLAWWSAAFFR